MRARLLALSLLASLLGADRALAQQGDDPLVSTAREWGGQHGVYTCEQWRAYVTRIYRIGDPRRRGFIEAADFERMKKASPVFSAASFDYFDMAGKGRVSQKEFIEFQSPFFARFDAKHTCHVTSEQMRASATPTETAAPAPTRGGRGGGGMGGGGMGGGGFGGPSMGGVGGFGGH